MMEKFERHSGTVIPINRSNVDTDAIMPKQYLKCISRSGYGDWLFDDWRYLDKGDVEIPVSERRLNPDFELNFPQHQGASIVLAQKNFGCGSSREHAVWGLKEYGIRVVVAPDFPDIFFNNCFNNGVLAIALEQAVIDLLFQACEADPTTIMCVDLELCQLTMGAIQVNFEVDDGRRHKLMQGLDNIAITLQKSQSIINFEQRHFQQQPWLLNKLQP